MRSPGSREAIASATPSGSVIALPSTLVTMSPSRTPAFSAGPPAVTEPTCAPDPPVAEAVVERPSHGRSTDWPACSFGTISRTVSDGTAKPMPTFPPPAPEVAICEFTPITRPLASSSGPAGVAGVDRRVGLDHLVDAEAVGRLDLALQAGDDPGRRGLVEAEREADGDRRVADLDGVGLGERERGDAVRRTRVDIEHREVRRRVRADDTGRDRARVIVEAHPDLARVADDVGVGDDRPVAIDQEAGAGPAARLHGDHGLARPRVDGVDLRRGELAGWTRAGARRSRRAPRRRRRRRSRRRRWRSHRRRPRSRGARAGGDGAAGARRWEGWWRAASLRARRASRRGGRSKGS